MSAVHAHPAVARSEPRWTHVDDHYVNGAWTRSTATARLPLVDPATGRTWGSVPDGSADDVDAALDAADRAFRTGPWPRTTPSQRAALLLRIADEVEARAAETASVNTLENGSPINETRGAAANAAGILRHVAGLASWLETEDVRPFPAGGAETVVRKDPVGPCVLIAPWNFPINLMVVKLAPALLAGCTVVMKPAPGTSLSIRFVVEACEAAGLRPGWSTWSPAAATRGTGWYGIRVRPRSPSPDRPRSAAGSRPRAATCSGRSPSNSAASPLRSCSPTPTSDRCPRH
ncbi:NAD/NADP-dependent betaine aldehyde dehydrogenase [Streptomyces hirsutus]